MYDGDIPFIDIESANHKSICHVECSLVNDDEDFVLTEEDRANAALIVKAVNHHAELVAGLESISKILVPGPHVDAKSGMAKALDALDNAREIARALLANLESVG